MPHVFIRNAYLSGTALKKESQIGRLGFELLVEDKDSQTFANSADVGEQIGQGFDRVHLFLKEFGFQEVGEIGILVVGS